MIHQGGINDLCGVLQLNGSVANGIEDDAIRKEGSAPMEPDSRVIDRDGL